jgi:hypothetical protein
MTSGWESVIRFEAENGAVYWSPLPLADSYQSLSQVRGYESIEDIQMGNGGREVTIKKVGHHSTPLGLDHRLTFRQSFCLPYLTSAYLSFVLDLTTRIMQKKLKYELFIQI